MLKFLVVNDPHNSDRPPIGRTESYADDIIAKQEECWDIAARAGCHYIVQTGDIFHRFRGPIIAYSLTIRLLDLYRRAPVPVLAIAGNHDMSMDGVESIQRMPFGVLAASGAFHWLAHPHRVEAGGEKVVFIPRNWRPGIDDLPTVFKLSKAERGFIDDDAYAVMVAHASVTPPGQSVIYPHHQADKIPTDLIDLLICGHIHEDLGIHQLPSGCWFANVGSLARVDRSKHNLERRPEVLVVSIGGGQIDFERHPLQSARPADEVFFEKDVVVEREMSDFAAAIASTVNLEETPLDELIAEHTKGKPPEVANRLRYYLTEVA